MTKLSFFYQNPIKIWLWRLFLVLVISLGLLLGISFYYNHRAGSPIPLASPNNPTTQAVSNQNPSNNTVLSQRLTINDHGVHPHLDKLIARFTEHYPAVTVIQNADTADVHLGQLSHKPPNNDATMFAYALAGSSSTQKGINDNTPLLVGKITTQSEAALLFRDFMLSSIAQDIWIDEGFDSIEPYRNLSHAFFDRQQNNDQQPPTQDP